MRPNRAKMFDSVLEQLIGPILQVQRRTLKLTMQCLLPANVAALQRCVINIIRAIALNFRQCIKLMFDKNSEKNSLHFE